MQVILYGLNKCGTCQKARAWLDERGIAHQFIDYRDQPIEPGSLCAWAAQFGWEKLVNRASLTWRNLPAERKTPASEAEWLALVAEYPSLIRRPVTVIDGQAGLGFSDKSYRGRFDE